MPRLICPISLQLLLVYGDWWRLVFFCVLFFAFASTVIPIAFDLLFLSMGTN